MDDDVINLRARIHELEGLLVEEQVQRAAWAERALAAERELERARRENAFLRARLDCLD